LKAIPLSYEGFNITLRLTPQYFCELGLQDYSSLYVYLKKIHILFIDDFGEDDAYKFIPDSFICPRHNIMFRIKRLIKKLVKSLRSYGVEVVMPEMSKSKLHIYARSWNIARIDKGMGGLMYNE